MKTVWGTMLVGSLLASPLCQAASTCADVYADSVANISLKIRTSAEYDYLWNKHCEINGNVRSESSQTDLSATVKIFQLGFSGNRQEALQTMQRFCKEHLEQHQSQSSAYDYDRNIVVGSQKSYNECRALEINGVHISHTVQDPRSIVVRVDFNPSTTKVVFRHAVFDPSAGSCLSTGLSADGAPMEISATTKEMPIEKPFSIVCERKAEKTTMGSSKFERFTFELDTNQGPYSVDMPVEEMLGYDLASENKRRDEAHIAEEQALKSQNEGLQKQLDGLTADIHEFFMGEDAAVTCPDWGGNPNEYAKSICKDKKYKLQTLAEAGGRHCGYWRFVVACLDLGK